MIDGVMERDTHKYRVLFKLQLFKKAGENVALQRHIFDYAFYYAGENGYDLSASVFDEESLDWLLARSPAFVKIACVPELHRFALMVPSETTVYCSFPTDPGPVPSNVHPLCCVRKYPASILEYELAFSDAQMRIGISDHTAGWKLLKRYKPDVFEKHVVDIREDGNPDAGPFAATLAQLGGVI
jgi:sialic acid synthase SpsE